VNYLVVLGLGTGTAALFYRSNSLNLLRDQPFTIPSMKKEVYGT